MNDMQKHIEVQDGEVIKRLKWPFTQKQNEEYLSRLERYKATFTLALSTLQKYVHTFRLF
jgi:hypothetical protein